MAAPSIAEGGRLPVLRYAEPFEALRDRAERQLDAGGSRPQVTLVTLGSTAAYGARVGFARELFGVAGIEAVIVDFDGQHPLSDVGPVACLCSSDAVYAERAAATVSALRSTSVERIMVAGRPDAAFGADGFVFAGCDALAALTETLDAVEVHA